MLILSNANAIQCQTYQEKYKGSKQQEKILGKFTTKRKSGGGKKRTKAVPRNAVGFARHPKINRNGRSQVLIEMKKGK